MLGLGELLKRYPGQLSGGQRQRVAMGRAIVRSPQGFLFDEPLSNLDARLRLRMRTELKALHHRLKTTTIYVTHDQLEATILADTTVVMNEGRIEQIATPQEIFDRPANTYVAGFIGSNPMNMLNGVAEVTGDHHRIRVTGRVGFDIPWTSQVKPGDTTVFGIRPEDIAIDLTGDGPLTTVKLLEPMGHETLVFCDVDGVELCVLTPLRFKLSIGVPFV